MRFIASCPVRCAIIAGKVNLELVIEVWDGFIYKILGKFVTFIKLLRSVQAHAPQLLLLPASFIHNIDEILDHE